GFRFAKRDVDKKVSSISKENTKFHEMSREEQKNNFEIYLDEIKKISEFKSLLIIGSDLEVSLGIARENCQEVKALEMNAVRDQTLQECWKELHSNIEIIIKENKFFDLVMILGELERIPNLQRFLLQLQKIMHKDSLVLITANNNDSENSRRMRERWYDFYNQNFWYFTLYDLNKLFRKNDFEIILLKEEERYRIRNFLKDFWRELYGLLSNVYTVDRNRNLLIARKNSMDYVKNFLFQNNS
ncbi:MAG: methyltransferase domain-containing protein, partial [bacterium]